MVADLAIMSADWFNCMFGWSTGVGLIAVYIYPLRPKELAVEPLENWLMLLSSFFCHFLFLLLNCWLRASWTE